MEEYIKNSKYFTPSFLVRVMAMRWFSPKNTTCSPRVNYLTTLYAYKLFNLKAFIIFTILSKF
jgi:hypothetical protein